MAWKGLLMTMLIAASVAPGLGMDYLVEWTLNVSYTEWAAGKEFHVGDILTFLYTPGDHNVLEVDREDSQSCTSSDEGAVPHVSGNDTISLDSSGEKWYICDIKDHCLEGMKLGITVSEGPPGPSIGSSEAGKMTPPLRSCGWMLLVMAAGGLYIYRIIMG